MHPEIIRDAPSCRDLLHALATDVSFRMSPSGEPLTDFTRAYVVCAGAAVPLSRPATNGRGCVGLPGARLDRGSP